MSPQKETAEDLKTERNLREEVIAHLKDENYNLKHKNAINSCLLLFLTYISVMSLKSCHDHKSSVKNLFNDSKMVLVAPEEKPESAEEQAQRIKDEEACHQLGINYTMFKRLKDKFQRK